MQMRSERHSVSIKQAEHTRGFATFQEKKKGLFDRCTHCVQPSASGTAHAGAKLGRLHTQYQRVKRSAASIWGVKRPV